jgi:hypothetical protein
MAPIGRRLPTLLVAYSAGALQQMLAGREIDLADRHKAAALAALEAAAADPASVARMVEALSEEQRHLLDLLLLYPGEVSTAYVRDAALAAGLIDPERRQPRDLYYFGYTQQPTPGDPDAVHSRRLADLLAGLSRRVLALAGAPSGHTSTLDLGLTDRVAVPGEIRPILAGLRLPELPQLPEAPGPVESADPRRAHRALFLIWSLVRDKPLGLTQAGLLRKLDARRLGVALGVADKNTEFAVEPDLPYVYFMRQVAQGVGLLAPTEGGLGAATRARLQGFLALSWPARSLAMLRAWIAATAARSNGPLAGVDWQGGRSLLGPIVELGLARLLAAVGATPAAWVSVEALAHYMRLHHFGFLALAQEEPLAVYDLGSMLYHIGYGGPAGPDLWDLTEGRLIRETLATVLPTLGVVDLAGAGASLAFRVTGPGRALLAAFADPEHEAALLAPLADQAHAGRVIVQPNFQILAVGDVPDETLFSLSEVAELVRAEQVVEFKLTRPAIYIAQQAGWTPVAILDLLRGASGAPLAQNVERSILDWAAAHDRVVVRRDAALLVADSGALLDELAADPRVAPLLGDRLLPTVALLRPGSAGPDGAVAALDGVLLAAGRLPARTDIARDPPAPQFRFDPAGRVTWTGPLPDLRLLGLLAAVARPGPDGALALDERAVRASAVARRWGPPDVVALLDALAAWHAGPLPDAVTRDIKVWSGFQGRARLRTAVVLTVERPELLADLQADPALAPLLEPAPADHTAAWLPPDAADLATLRRALLDRGFTLDES